MKVNFDPFLFKSNKNCLEINILTTFNDIIEKKKIFLQGASIGRSNENTFVFPEVTSLSSHHAVITFDEGDFYITDLGSKLGTYILINELEL